MYANSITTCRKHNCIIITCFGCFHLLVFFHIFLKMFSLTSVFTCVNVLTFPLVSNVFFGSKPAQFRNAINCGRGHRDERAFGRFEVDNGLCFLVFTNHGDSIFCLLNSKTTNRGRSCENVPKAARKFASPSESILFRDRSANEFFWVKCMASKVAAH